jgi:predicted esterase
VSIVHTMSTTDQIVFLGFMRTSDGAMLAAHHQRKVKSAHTALGSSGTLHARTIKRVLINTPF